jgi:hypothetical protein
MSAGRRFIALLAVFAALNGFTKSFLLTGQNYRDIIS